MLNIQLTHRYNLPKDLGETFAIRQNFEQSTTDFRAHGRHVGSVVSSVTMFASELLIGRNTPPVQSGLQTPYHAPGSLSAFRDKGVVGSVVGGTQFAIAEVGALLGVIVGTVPYAVGAMRGTNNAATMATYACYGKQAGVIAASIAGVPAVIGLRILRDVVSEVVPLATHGAGTAAGVLLGASIGILTAPAQVFKAHAQAA